MSNLKYEVRQIWEEQTYPSGNGTATQPAGWALVARCPLRTIADRIVSAFAATASEGIRYIVVDRAPIEDELS